MSTVTPWAEQFRRALLRMALHMKVISDLSDSHIAHCHDIDAYGDGIHQFKMRGRELAISDREFRGDIDDLMDTKGIPFVATLRTPDQRFIAGDLD